MTKVIFTVRILAREMVLVLLTRDGSPRVAAAGAEGGEGRFQVLQPPPSTFQAPVLTFRFLQISWQMRL